ncbi:MAG: nitroreductase family deazaflavin-dependent oxidoreductase [Actinomycetota bacterium]|nr:nitroreductase family deazaflavin-dependent oxidoreductase [Actinomycetota bacterium]
MSALQLPLFLIMPPRGFGVLTTTGRKTGRRRRKCVRAIREGDKVFLVSLRGRFGAWFRNLEAYPDVEIRIRGGRFKGLAREVTDPIEHEQARRAFCETVNFFDRLEHRAHRRGRPTPDRIRALHARWFSVGMPVVIELRPTATRGTIQS